MSLANLLRQTITIYNKSSLDKFAKQTFGSGTDAQARFQLKTINRMLPNQETVIVSAIVYVLPTVTVEIGDKIVYNSVNYEVITKSSDIDGVGGSNHIKLELAKWA